MIDKHYPFFASNSDKYFLFESVGPKGKILKLVAYTDLGGGRWNLGFGDFANNEINDSAITDNADSRMVLQTVAKTIYEFFNSHPNSIIVISPVDRKRNILYNYIFKNRIEEINLTFEIFGIIENHKEFYDPKKFYDSFEIKEKTSDYGK